ncbi:leucine-rich repeat, immunoglobulin-like domain and transmembrane domain-containing protein 2 [Bufo gargarizans]|uniref:leucine-rich repeat, immunoglobulin-like domain and transmembrane domain-containing protein 2 n=1 Tax=Bufo gargarizans TaxID=30331 RepID=UPI001CF40CCD|nr:leucine-rich repeat, immunoglobulin-like domain and transmembrane domain-containing protein 2 [Bufo gargarizans]
MTSSLNRIPADVPPDIRKIRIEKCHLTELSRGMFSGVSSLEYLWLNFNNITLMHMKSLEYLKSLQELRLQGNKLRSVPWTAFQDTPALRILDLKHNRLDVLPEHALKFLSNLTYLDLSFNQLTIISKDVFSNWPLHQISHAKERTEVITNVVLALHDNPWMCDCRLNGFVNFVKTVSPPIILMNSYLICATPDYRAGKFFHELELKSCMKPITNSLVSNITVQIGLNVTLVCFITASPTPSILWTYGLKASNIKAYNNVSNSLIDEETIKSELVIPIIHLADAGVYNCLAKNFLGNSTSSIIVQVQSPRGGDPSMFPSYSFSPSLSSDENVYIDVRIAKQTVYGISLEWFAATENPSETWYTIYFGKYDEKDKDVINIGPGIYTYSVNDLLPTTKYEVCITLKSQRPRKGQCIVFMTGSDISELEQREKLIHIIVIVCAMVLAVPAGMYACTTETRLNCIEKCLGLCRRRRKVQKNLKKDNTKDSTFDSLQASSEEGLCQREVPEENRRRRCSEDKLNKAKPENKNPAELY